MTSDKQKEAAKVNIIKAQKKWQEMTPRERALAQPEGRKRAKPGTTGEGEYFRSSCVQRMSSLPSVSRMWVKRGISSAWPENEAADPGIRMPGSSVKRMPILKAIHWLAIMMIPNS